jgi:hypothetical protein
MHIESDRLLAVHPVRQRGRRDEFVREPARIGATTLTSMTGTRDECSCPHIFDSPPYLPAAPLAVRPQELADPRILQDLTGRIAVPARAFCASNCRRLCKKMAQPRIPLPCSRYLRTICHKKAPGIRHRRNFGMFLANVGNAIGVPLADVKQRTSRCSIPSVRSRIDRIWAGSPLRPESPWA